MKQKLLLLGAVLFGVLAFMFTFSQINKEKARLQGETYKIYLIQVARDIPPSRSWSHRRKSRSRGSRGGSGRSARSSRM